MIDVVLEPRHRELGMFATERVLPGLRVRRVGPYVLLDHSGPEAQTREHRLAIPAHPHIGLSTLTYLFAGEIVHRDSLGSTQVIRPGEVNWMTAGRGIVHSERVAAEFATSGGLLHALQLWVGLTEAHEETAPDFQHLGATEVPRVEDEGAIARLVAGSAYGLTSPLRTFTPQFYVDLRLAAGARFALPAEHEERAAYVVDGRVRGEGAEGSFAARHLVVFGRGGEAPVVVAESPATVMLLGGAPIPAPHMWWNVVSSRAERIEEAKRDWREGRFVLPPDDADEIVPLPER
jgi:redox-sensitive bicupin YhaK (pirin superfamily)